METCNSYLTEVHGNIINHRCQYFLQKVLLIMLRAMVLRWSVDIYKHVEYRWDYKFIIQQFTDLRRWKGIQF